MTIEILVIGTGQLGSRHLQAIAKIPAANITVIDSSSSSLELAKSRYEEVNENFNSTITYSRFLEACPEKIDICIIATSSKPRKHIIEQVLNNCKIKYLILEKVLFQKPEDFNEIELLLNINQVNAYINCPRRTFDFYKDLQKIISPPLNMEVSGINWGMACNSIHFIDLFCYFTKDVKNLKFSTENLENHIYESKRKGYLEVNGHLSIYQNESSLSLQCNEDFNQPLSFKIKVKTKGYNIEILETDSPYLRIENMQTGHVQKYSIRIPYQSQMTDKIIFDLLENGTCSLTPYNESKQIHLPYIEALIEFESKITKTKITHCNIT